ncbi:MAG: DUF5665 domain-containing protein [Clostridia bacterium]|jgi:hypothetical protein|nr:DUF5665 domain-containing protein [Clostridia bacterium]
MEQTKELEDRVHKLAVSLEKTQITEYVNYLNDTKKLILTNLLAGLARGVGMTVGFTILGAVILYFLQKLVLLNLPLIGDFIANIVRLVNFSLQK